MSSSLSQTFSNLTNTYQHHRLPIYIALLTLSTPLLYLITTDYNAWYRLGRGGLPQNPFGYIIQTLLRPLKAPRFETSIYSSPKVLSKAGPNGQKSYLSPDEIPSREGPRPEVCKHILPQRQLEEKSSQVAKEKYYCLIKTLASTHPSALLVSTSLLERGGQALFLSPSYTLHPGAKGTRREITHLHPSEGSMHISLSPPDAKLIIERGWGERFGLSGTIVPVTYVMIYAPRLGDKEERDCEVVEKIVRAGVRFMLGEEK